MPGAGQPSWSPDSSEVAFLSSYGRIGEMGRVSDIAVVSRDGGQPRIIYRPPPLACLVPPGGTASSYGAHAAKPDVLTLMGWTR